MPWTDLCKVSELVEGEGRLVGLAEDRNVAVFLKDGKIYATDDRCPHAGGSLSGGMIEEGYIICPWHYWGFSLEDGTMASGGRAKIRVYPVRVQGEGADAIVQADI